MYFQVNKQSFCIRKKKVFKYFLTFLSREMEASLQ